MINHKTIGATILLLWVCAMTGMAVMARQQGEFWRVIRVDTPEIHHPTKPVGYYGPEAAEYVRRLVEGKRVSLELDRSKYDYYGRLLAYVRVDTVDVNGRLVRLGYGRALVRYPFSRKREFMDYERSARAARLGLWGKPEKRGTDAR